MKEEKVLHLSLKSKWYNMIECGFKSEEYREIKAYWVQRLCIWSNGRKINKHEAEVLASNVERLDVLIERGNISYVEYTRVKFSYGYTSRAMTYKIRDIFISKGRAVWGAPEDVVFIITLGCRL